MGVHQKLSTDELICDLLAEGFELDEIAAKLRMSFGYVESRFKVICARLGAQAR